ncbi:MAG: type III pantothenate kinase [Endozoicomonas sp. (ex Botrylloides leachii)]|nr:type III pantothenate kinase [Endozoicomonas sp. (ex Botrylloides leachii)]
MNQQKDNCSLAEGKILELDAGNTRLKWRVVEGGQLVDAGYLINTDNWQRKLPILIDGLGKIVSARASLVSGEEKKALLTTVIRDQCGIDIRFASTCQSMGNITLPYNLGVDRWLAILAAERKHPNQMKLVVDCGTALTLDVVAANGHHLGGYIAPGLGLMAQALHANTADLMLVEKRTDSDALGKTTADCISRGNLAMTTAFVCTQAQKYSNALVCLSGGDGEYIKPFITSPVDYQPDLVMDGLALALP